jgi:hypothetical protein
VQSNVLRRVVDQIDLQPELALARPADVVEVPLEMVRKQRTSAAAFTLACTVSGLDDKEVYLSLGIDAGHFSRIKKGDAGFPPDRLAEFCALVKNTVYPEWISFQVGCTLVMIQTEAERRAAIATARADAFEAENKLMRQLLQGRAA